MRSFTIDSLKFNTTLAQGTSQESLHALSRRTAISGLLGLGASLAGVTPPALASQARPQAQLVNKSPIILGQSVSLDGPLADIGRPMYTGAKACFESINAAGGINGRHVQLMAKNDGYDVKRSLTNVQEFLADKNTFALFGCMGTPMVEAMLPLLKGTDVPCFAPFTGATSVRPTDMRNLFHIRASFAEETTHLVQHWALVGHKKVAIVYQGNAYGKEVVNAAQQALRTNSIQALAAIDINNDGSNAEAVAKQILALKPEAVLIGLAGKPNVAFVNAIRAQESGNFLPLYAVSAMGSPTVLNALKEKAYGITISQVMPYPSNTKREIVRDFLQTWRQLGSGVASYPAFEGYFYARVFAEILKKSGPNVTRAGFIDNAWSMKHHNFGGYEIGFDRPGRSASRFVELTMVGRDGNFVL
jgi:branched-chain amino acid transport system substrate-binding protein